MPLHLPACPALNENSVGDSSSPGDLSKTVIDRVEVQRKKRIQRERQQGIA
jgi:hypothetical protein